MLQDVALRYVKSMMGAVSSKSCGPAVVPFAGACFRRPVLRQTDSIEGVHFLQLVLASEVEDHAAGFARMGCGPACSMWTLPS